MNLTHYYFDDEAIEQPSHLGPVRGMKRQYFNDESALDVEISVLPFSPYVALYLKSQLESEMTTAEGGVVQIGPVEVDGGTPPYSYQWYKNSAVANNSSSKTDTYTSGTLSASDNGAVYFCEVSDSKGNTINTNSVTLSVTSA